MEKIIKQSSLPLPSLSLSSLSPPNNIHNNIFCDTFSNPKNSIFPVFLDPSRTLPTPFSYLLSLSSLVSLSLVRRISASASSSCEDDKGLLTHYLRSNSIELLGLR